MKEIKEKICWLISLVIMISFLGACQQKETTDQEANHSFSKTVNTAKEEERKTRPKITFCTTQTSFGGSAIDPDLIDEVKAVIEENTNVDIELITPPLSSYNEKLNVLLSSGDIPDLFTISQAMNNLQIYAARGYTRPLDDLIDEYPQIKQVVREENFQYATVDNKLHGLPRYVPLSKVIWGRKDLFDQYGVNLSTTPTTEEFYTEMKKLVGHGIVPFTFPKWLDNLQYFYNAFGAYAGIAIDENGQYYDAFNSKEMREALAYIKLLYDEGIWDKEFLTNENANTREKISTGRAASGTDYFNRFIYYSIESEKQNAFTEFFPIYQLNGPNGGAGNLNEAIQMVVSVSSQSKEPEAAMDVANWYFFTEEGETLGILGIEGLHYTIENGVISPLDKAVNSGYNCSINDFFLSNISLPDFPFKWDETTEKYLDKQIEVNETVKNHLGPKYLIPGNKSELYDTNQPSYKKKMEEIASKIILGATTIEEGFAEYEAFWESIDGDQMITELNK
ncbi:MAG: extracellular solute-binding protein [Epulopiscium sp.]|nr:extracellular solute-binding protein [Candidatus Epulonipiscium sp.]